MNSNLGDYPGVTQLQVDELKTLKDIFTAGLTDHVAKQAAAKAATQTKDGQRVTLEALLRVVRNIAKAAGASKDALKMIEKYHSSEQGNDELLLSRLAPFLAAGLRAPPSDGV